jgi:ankyrin repeat protein
MSGSSSSPNLYLIPSDLLLPTCSSFTVKRIPEMLLRLPNELLQCIAENLEFGEHINAFARTNTYLYNLLNPYLYCCDVQHFGNSALMWAAKHGQEATAQKSLEAGAHAQPLSKYKETPLSLAARNGHEVVVTLLLATEGVNPDSQDSNGRTPLSWAARYGHEAVVTLLLATEGVNPDSQDSNGWTPLSWAAEYGHEAVIKLLLATEGVNPDSQDYNGRTHLSWAARYGYEVVVKLLLATEGVNPDSQDSNGRTPLSWAARYGHEAVVNLLLATEGVNPDSQDSNGRTPLSWAAEYGHEAVIKLLLATEGVNPNYMNSCGETLLLGNKTQELLDRARGPVGPPVLVDFGTEHRPLAELAELLSTMNGFFAFNAGVQIFHVGGEGAAPELLLWNTAQTWKDTFEGLAEDIFCFGQDVLGTQYAIRNGSEVVSFDPENARTEHIGHSLEDWSVWLLENPSVHATSTLAKVWQDREGALEPNQRLIPWTFLVFGGEVVHENLTVKDAVEAMRVRGPIAAATRDLPPGSAIKLIPVMPRDPVNDTSSGRT